MDEDEGGVSGGFCEGSVWWWRKEFLGGGLKDDEDKERRVFSVARERGFCVR